MSFESPRKLERIHTLDVIFKDMLNSPSSIYELCDILKLNQGVKDFVKETLDITEQDLYSVKNGWNNQEPSIWQELSDYILKVIKEDIDRVCNLHQQEINRYFDSVRRVSVSDAPKRKVRPSTLCAASIPFTPSSQFSINSSSTLQSSFPALSSRFLNDSNQSNSLSPPSTPPRTPRTPRTPKSAKSPVRSPGRLSLPPPAFITTPEKPVVKESLPPIRSLHQVDISTIPRRSEITVLAVLLSLILRSACCRSLLQEIQFFVKLLGCGMEIEYDSPQPLLSHPPWCSLGNCTSSSASTLVNFPFLLNPTHCFLLATTLLNSLSDVLSLLPTSSLSTLNALSFLSIRSDFAPDDSSLPPSILHFHSNADFHLQQQTNESKQYSVNPEATALYNNRQKTLDAFMILLRSYEMSTNQVSVYNLENVQKRMFDQVNTLLDNVNCANYHFLARIFVEEFFNVTLPSKADELYLRGNNIQFFQTVFLRMFQIPILLESSGMEECINAIFPGKQGFFALFLYYGQRHHLNCFILNELTRVIGELHSQMLHSTDCLLHALIIARNFMKLLGYICFSPFWELLHSSAPFEDAACYFSIPFDLNTLASEAWEAGCYELFLMWITPFFYFVPAQVILKSKQLKPFFQTITQYFIAVKSAPITTSSFSIIITTEQIFQILHITPSFIPLLFIEEAEYESALTPSLTLFLLQSFYTDFASLNTTISTIYQLFNRPLDSSETPAYSSSARKIRPRDVDHVIQQPANEFTTLSNPSFERSMSLLANPAKKQPEVYQVITNLAELLIREKAKEQITKEYCNAVIKAEHACIEKHIEEMYNAVRSESIMNAVDSAKATSAMTTEVALKNLKLRTENLILTHVLQGIRKCVVDQLVQSFQSSEYQKVSLLFDRVVFQLVVQEKSYGIIRKIVVSIVEGMFEEGRKARNLLLIKEFQTSTEISRVLTEEKSLAMYCKVVSTLLTELHTLITNYRRVEQECYSFVNDQKWREVVNSHYMTCCQYLHLIYQTMREDIAQCSSFVALAIDFIAQLSNFLISDAMYGMILKEFCQILLRFHRLSNLSGFKVSFKGVDEDTIVQLDSERKRMAFSIFLVYLIKPGILTLESLADLVFSLWKRALARGESVCKSMTKWILSLFSVYSSDLFREIFPAYFEPSFLSNVIDALLTYWEDKPNPDIQRFVSANKCIFIL